MSVESDKVRVSSEVNKEESMEEKYRLKINNLKKQIIKANKKQNFKKIMELSKEAYELQQKHKDDKKSKSSKNKKKKKRVTKRDKKLKKNMDEFRDVGKEILDLVNEYRLSKDITDTLHWSETMHYVCCQHSLDMSEEKVPFSHDGFEDRIKRFSFKSRRTAENCCLLSSRPKNELAKEAMDGWITSPGHEANLRGNFNTCAIGICKSDDDKYYFTQMFGLRAT